jgi:hypothetical protein
MELFTVVDTPCSGETYHDFYSKHLLSQFLMALINWFCSQNGYFITFKQPGNDQTDCSFTEPACGPCFTIFQGDVAKMDVPPKQMRFGI